MKLTVTVTKDVIAEDCQRAINLYENAATAKRAWGNGINYLLKNGNPDNIPIKDLQLWKIGEFDTQTMEFTPCKEFIAAGAEFIVNFVPTQPQEAPVAEPVAEAKENKGE